MHVNTTSLQSEKGMNFIMNWIDKMNLALSYIEENLDTDIDNYELAKIVDCSFFHFQKIFYYMANITLAEYIRRRKLTLAAFELQNTDQKVIDIAIKYGYDSPTAFTRAFQKMHHMTPTQAKSSKKVFTAYSPISFQISIKGVQKMNYSIIEKECFRIVGMRLITNIADGDYYKKIEEFWDENTINGLLPKLLKINDGNPKGILGVAIGDWENKGEFNYYIAVTSNKAVIPEGMEVLEIKQSKWAVFDCTGKMPTALRNMQQRIATEWFPQSGYKYSNLPDIELYSDGNTLSDDYKTQVWVPVSHT